jgi:hypothetical protein
LKKTPERDGRGSVRPPIIEDLKKVDLLKAAQSWFENADWPDVALTPTETGILWILGPMDLTQNDAATLLGLSYQRVSFLYARSVRKLREAVR